MDCETINFDIVLMCTHRYKHACTYQGEEEGVDNECQQVALTGIMV